MSSSPGGARVIQVSVSSGGVPKLPVEGAWVSTLGVEGDAHHERTVHGGPHRAVCLFAIEAIERLQAEGHPVDPGSVGENLTTTGVEWSTLPVGTRARVGDALLLEIASSTTPCETQRPNFRDGRFSRINIELHPSDSRMYARVLEEGYIKPGDAIKLLPPASDSRSKVHALLDQLDRPEKSSSLKLWAAARAAGYEMHVLDDGDICAGASTELDEPAFNHAQGLRMMPQLLPEIVAHFRAAGTSGLVPYVAPTPDAAPETTLAVHAVVANDARDGAPPPGVEVVRIGDADERRVWIETYVEQLEPARAGAWRKLLAHLLAERDVHALLGLVDGRPAGVGLLYVRRHAGMLRGGGVLPGFRGRGLHRALIGARVRLALELGCEVVGATAELDSIASRNFERVGLPRIETHPVFRFTPSQRQPREE